MTTIQSDQTTAARTSDDAAPIRQGSMAGLRAEGVRFAFGRNDILHGVDLHVEAGQVVGLVGPNGSGKTTALRCCYRGLVPNQGHLWLHGDEVSHYGRRQLAQNLGVAVQEPAPTPGLTVRESVALGRSPHRPWFAGDTADDAQIVTESLAEVGLEALADRDVAHLSGGERQRVSLARALATRAEVLLLDEPTNHLDLHHQIGVLELLRRRVDSGLAIVVTLHDLRMAVETCDQLVVLDHGQVAAAGPPAQVLTSTLLADVFGVRGSLVPGPDGVTLSVTGRVTPACYADDVDQPGPSRNPDPSATPGVPSRARRSAQERGEASE